MLHVDVHVCDHGDEDGGGGVGEDAQLGVTAGTGWLRAHRSALSPRSLGLPISCLLTSVGALLPLRASPGEPSSQPKRLSVSPVRANTSQTITLI